MRRSKRHKVAVSFCLAPTLTILTTTCGFFFLTSTIFCVFMGMNFLHMGVGFLGQLLGVGSALGIQLIRLGASVFTYKLPLRSLLG